MADLSGGAHLARLLGVRDPGIHPVSQDGATLLVTVPKPDDVAPAGPIPGNPSAGADGALANASSSADLLLSLATVDPAFGSDHLGTWATHVVAVVTAGRSSAVKIHGIGELIRLAGMRLDSVVLIGADLGGDRSRRATTGEAEGWSPLSRFRVEAASGFLSESLGRVRHEEAGGIHPPVGPGHRQAAEARRVPAGPERRKCWTLNHHVYEMAGHLA